MLSAMMVHRRFLRAGRRKIHESTASNHVTIRAAADSGCDGRAGDATLIKMYDRGSRYRYPGHRVSVEGHYNYLGQDVEFFSNLATPAEQIHNKEAKASLTCLRSDKPWCCRRRKVRFLVTPPDR